MPAVSVRLRSIAPRLSRRHALVRRALQPAGPVRARVLLLRRLLRLLLRLVGFNRMQHPLNAR